MSASSRFQNSAVPPPDYVTLFLLLCAAIRSLCSIKLRLVHPVEEKVVLVRRKWSVAARRVVMVMGMGRSLAGEIGGPGLAPQSKKAL